MKRMLTIMLLVLAISASLIAGTLSMYTITIDDLASGSVVAKEFVFVEEGVDSFQKGVKIAPTENEQWQFTVKNYDASGVTETDLYYRLTFQVGATEGKEPIEPLLVTVNGEEIKTEAGVGSLDVEGKFLVDENGQEDEYMVEIYWPDGDGDINYAGNSFGTTVKVAAVARQLPFDWVEPEIPEEPEEPESSGILVEYKTKPQNWHGNDFHYYITITNNSGEVIEDWEMTFSLPTERLNTLWGGPVLHDLGEGSYRIVHQETNPKLNPDQTMFVDGVGTGSGVESPENVLVNGTPVELICSLSD